MVCHNPYITLNNQGSFCIAQVVSLFHPCLPFFECGEPLIIPKTSFCISGWEQLTEP